MKKKLFALILVLVMLPAVVAAGAQSGFAESRMDFHHAVIGGDQSITIRSHTDPGGRGGYSHALYAVELTRQETKAELDAKAVLLLENGVQPIWGGSKHCYHGGSYTADPAFTMTASDYAPGSYLYVCYTFGCTGEYNHNLTPYYSRISTMSVRVTREAQGLELNYTLTDAGGRKVAALSDGEEAVLELRTGTVKLDCVSSVAYPTERIVDFQVDFPADQSQAAFTFDQNTRKITPVLCGSGSITVTIGNYLDASTRTETICLTVPCTSNPEPTVIMPDTCTEDGLAVYLCPGHGINCETSFDEIVLPAKGHSLFSISQYVEKPTATLPGIGMGTCKKCGFIGVEQEVPPIFSDVAPDASYSRALDYCYSKGWVSGTSPDTFEPSSSCSRAQVVTFLWRAAGCPEPSIKINPFVDVPEQTYYYEPVLWAVESGITTGTDATHFSPTNSCPRSQVVTFLWRSFGQPESEAAVHPFTDVTAGSWYEQAVLWAVEHGITTGTSGTTFSPNATCTRAQIVTFLYRAYAE